MGADRGGAILLSMMVGDEEVCMKGAALEEDPLGATEGVSGAGPAADARGRFHWAMRELWFT